MARMILASRSRRPPTKSRTEAARSPVASSWMGSSSMPLMVKSRRWTSSAGSVENFGQHLAGGRRSRRRRCGRWRPRWRCRALLVPRAQNRDAGVHPSVGGGADRVTHNQNDAEVGADGEGLREERDDLVRRGGGGDVVVLGGVAEEEVADAAAGEVGLVARVAQGADDGESGAVVRPVCPPPPISDLEAANCFCFQPFGRRVSRQLIEKKVFEDKIFGFSSLPMSAFSAADRN